MFPKIFTSRFQIIVYNCVSKDKIYGKQHQYKEGNR